jgi:diaminopimelate epimerase
VRCGRDSRKRSRRATRALDPACYDRLVAGFLSFLKYEGLGNDFIVVQAAEENAIPPERASVLCERRFGVGADGVILMLPPRAPDCAVRMRVVNADGSIPEMCGNGVRCVALLVARAARLEETTVLVDTDAGPRACRVDDRRGSGLVSVDMGLVRVVGERTVPLNGRSIEVTAADAGNPHVVLFGAFARRDVEDLGPRLATHSDFPRGTNVEFAYVGRDGIDVVVWERGVGITLACGTGACAVAAVACANGAAHTGTPLAMRLPGGTLDVTIDDDGRATMRGPARYVFSGTLEG